MATRQSGPAAGAAAGSTPMMKLENTEKRDTLIEIEKRYQKRWRDAKLFEANAPTLTEVPLSQAKPEDLHRKHPKSFYNFAFPYMNGTLHVGHSFTVSKAEFMTGFSRMQGKRTLFPLGFHCTGMPIKACADKLVDEVKRFGTNFERYQEDDSAEPSVSDAKPAPTQAQTKEDVTKFTAKKGKAAAKTVKAKYQFQIMVTQGIPKEEIHKFADPAYWLHYFPPLCVQDLSNFGARIDWRRQFVTTDANRYFDSFVRWQMNRLHELNKIQFGSRYTIYSPKDGQPCMDHDRSEGEAILPQEYTALKLRVKQWSPKAAEKIQSKLPAGANVFFVPATLRPETMYGQTCCFVGPSIMYGIFKASENEYFVFTKRGAWNLAFQGYFFDNDNFARDQKQLEPVIELPGSAFVGTLVVAPLSMHSEGVRILPMETVLATKGTGVVTSVPSDSPDDYATVRDLAKKAEYYGIQKEWAELEIPPIIETPSYGNLTAKFLVEKMKINSPKDAKVLAEAKDLAYKEGFYKGKMLVGDFKGESVESAKPKVREALIKAGQAFAYAEPAGRVVSRSGDECVVAYLGQWFLNYGDQDPEWRDLVAEHVRQDLKTYNAETKNAFEGVLDWLNRWACARTYGLGSKLPWDPKFLVESLSDSTIYMAYYTVAHFLHSDIFGTKPGIFDIKPEQMIDDAWNHLFGHTAFSDDLGQKTRISKDQFNAMRREFEYWYPVDMRGSGKDLIPNHLTFFLYNHAALFPRHQWPRSIRVNGHLLLNGEKMSKSTGNFLTLSEATRKFGADAMRIALADAGDGIEDANFDEAVANSTILRLHTLKEWSEEIVLDKSLRSGPKDAFLDRVFENEIIGLTHEVYKHYDDTNFKMGLKAALYDFTSARDFYREATTAAGIPMHRDLITKYLELQALVLTPLAPHWSDYIWSEVLKKPSSIQVETWPTLPVADSALTAAREYVRATTSAITSAESAQLRRKDKGKSVPYDPKQPKRLTIFVATSWPSWQAKYVDLVREDFGHLDLNSPSTATPPASKEASATAAPASKAPPAAASKSAADGGKSGSSDKEMATRVAQLAASTGAASETKKAMPFVQGLRKRLLGGEAPSAVFERKLPFDEPQVLREMLRGVARTTGCAAVEIIRVGDSPSTESTSQSAPRSTATSGDKREPATNANANKRGGIVIARGDADGMDASASGQKVADLAATADAAVPGSPSFVFENIAST